MYLYAYACMCVYEHTYIYTNKRCEVPYSCRVTQKMCRKIAVLFLDKCQSGLEGSTQTTIRSYNLMLSKAACFSSKNKLLLSCDWQFFSLLPQALTVT